MPHLTIHLKQGVNNEPCGLCGKQAVPPAGLELCLVDNLAHVCHDCGKQHAPSLAALLHLAHVAHRVARIGRHTLVPPLEALLDLAHAAEVYTSTPPGPRRRAA